MIKNSVLFFGLIAFCFMISLAVKSDIENTQLAKEELAAIQYYVNNDEFGKLHDMTIESNKFNSEMNQVLHNCQQYAIADFVGQDESTYSAALVGLVYKVCVDSIVAMKGKLN